MRLRRWILRGLLPVAAAFLAIAVLGGSLEGPASFSVLPVNPAANQGVLFTDTSTGLSPTGWFWEFGDGQSSASPAPSHVYSNPGNYTARLRVTTSSGTVETTRLVDVSAEGTLRLNAAHSFDVALFARDQRTGNTGEGKAIPQNDIFGYFAIPALTSNPDNPEVFVKVLDGTVINGQFWVFYGGLTDLEYTLTVKENQTGRVKTYQKAGGSACGGFDTSGFNVTAPPGATATPTPPAPTPTRTPTSGGSAQTIDIGVTTWHYTPGTTTPIEVTAGVATTLVFTSSSGTHGFSGIPELGVAGTSNISAGEQGDYGYPGTAPVVYRVTFTAPASTRGMTYSFACTVDSCGTGHTSMTGTLHVN